MLEVLHCSVKKTGELFSDPVLVSRIDISYPTAIVFFPFFFLIALLKFTPLFSSFFVVAFTFMDEIISLVYYILIYYSFFLLISLYFLILSIKTLIVNTKTTSNMIAIIIIEVIDK